MSTVAANLLIGLGGTVFFFVYFVWKSKQEKTTRNSAKHTHIESKQAERIQNSEENIQSSVPCETLTSPLSGASAALLLTGWSPFVFVYLIETNTPLSGSPIHPFIQLILIGIVASINVLLICNIYVITNQIYSVSLKSISKKYALLYSILFVVFIVIAFGSWINPSGWSMLSLLPPFLIPVLVSVDISRVQRGEEKPPAHFDGG
jgi:hypothetical protein